LRRRKARPFVSLKLGEMFIEFGGIVALGFQAAMGQRYNAWL
jgi:hypothetical protein